MRIRRFFSIILCLAVAAVLGLGGYAFFKDMDGPTIVMTPDTGRLSPTRDITLHLSDISGVRSVLVSVRRNNASTVVLRKHFSPYKPEETVTFSLKDTGIREGAFDLEIKATDASLSGFGMGNSRTLLRPTRLDAQPPRISVKTLPPNIRRGGTGVIRYAINKEVTRTGVKVGNLFFQGYAQPDNTYICFFAFPHILTPGQFAPEIFAEDLAGNVTASRLTVRAMDRPFKRDVLNITDDFLAKVSEALYDLAPNAPNNLERFLTINRDIRLANIQFLWHLGQDTAKDMLWDGMFARLSRSAARAGYGDHRTYMYNNQKIDEQYHLGFDLASLVHAEIPAGNNGRVVFVGYLGIYGNVVVVDHGLGVMSLYSHMSSMRVKTGDLVKKGDIIGNTGITGMAFGDHLHVGILVGGIEVTPLEWLDPKWIKDNVTDRLAVK